MSNTTTCPSCASWARELGVEPAGTAPQFDVLVLVEHPLPWSRDVQTDPLLRRLTQVAADELEKGRTVRLQAAAIGPEPSERRVVVFDRGEGPFAGYGRSEGSALVDGLAELVSDLVGRPGFLPSTMNATDVLIRTHGTRDRCCGSMGIRLWTAQRGLDSVRVRRTSHTDGHRLAPTAITFPDGTCLAHVDENILPALADRSLPAWAAASRLRGCTAFGQAVQAADGAVLTERGWEWLSYARHGEDCGSNRVELHFEAPSSERGTYACGWNRGVSFRCPTVAPTPPPRSSRRSSSRWLGHNWHPRPERGHR